MIAHDSLRTSNEKRNGLCPLSLHAALFPLRCFPLDIALLPSVLCLPRKRSSFVLAIWGLLHRITDRSCPFPRLATTEPPSQSELTS
jgi:hypothetical protein